MARPKTQFWHLEYHEGDAESPWRWCDDATDSWLGIVCDEGADEVLDLTDWISVMPFGAVKELAYALIGAHAICFDLPSDVPAVREHFDAAVARCVRGFNIPDVPLRLLVEDLWETYSLVHDAELA